MAQSVDKMLPTLMITINDTCFMRSVTFFSQSTLTPLVALKAICICIWRVLWCVCVHFFR